jgi:hypothetical protein
MAGQGVGYYNGQTATNPQTGERVMFQNGQWTPLPQGGAALAYTGLYLQSHAGGGLNLSLACSACRPAS